MVKIRKAVIGDIVSIHKMINYYANQGLLLPRARSELYDHLRDFFVVPDEERPAPVDSTEPSLKGVCALGVCWENLAEVKSLAVAEDHQKRGIGSKLVRKCLGDAVALGLSRVFTLTYAPDFFVKLGFHPVDKSVLPHKIWADCLKCPKFPDCDEEALVIDL